MDNKQAIKLWRRRHSLHQKLDRLEGRYEQTWNDIVECEGNLEVIEHTRLHKGVLIREEKQYGRIAAVGDDIPRAGRVWKNKHQKGWWACAIIATPRWKTDREIFLGMDFKTKKECVQMILDFIVYAKMPKPIEHWKLTSFVEECMNDAERLRYKIETKTR